MALGGRFSSSRLITYLLVTSFVLVAGCSNERDPPGHRTDTTARHGGQIVAVLATAPGNAWSSGLDPATNASGSVNLSIMNAVFGGLFQLIANDDGTSPRIVGILASGYDILNEGRTLRIHLRRGVRFSDGTPLDAEALRFNIERNIEAACSCAPIRWPWAADDRVVVIDQHTVALNFARPYSAAIHNLPVLNINWPVSPTALAAMGEDEFRMRPVGAGPFTIVRNQLSFRLELERNPDYWQTDRPFLDRLIFQSMASEQAAYLSLLAGDAQAAEGIVSTPIIEQAIAHPRIAVTQQPATATYVIQLNTRAPPFDDERARQAIYYATDAEAIRAGLFRNRYPLTQSFMGPGGLFHHSRIPGYRTFDQGRARALVRELGGVSVRLGTNQSFVTEQLVTALQSQWQDAGIQTSIELLETGPLVDRFRSGQWQAVLQRVGSYDPESGSGVSLRFGSGQAFSGVADDTLDRILSDAAALTDRRDRDALYREAATLISDKAYAPFLVALAPSQLAATGAHGPGLTTRIPAISVHTAILWQDVHLRAE